MAVSANSQIQELLSAKFIKFCLVGFSGVVVDMAVFWLVSNVISSMPLSAIKLVSGSVAMLSNFYWNDLWTFRIDSNLGFKLKNKKSRFISFVIICGIGLLLGMFVVVFLHNTLGINNFISNFGAIIASTFWNYFMNSLISWGGES